MIALRGENAGDFLIAWESSAADTATGYDVAARILRSDGTLSPRFVLNSDEDQFDEGNPSLAVTDNGFIATWTQYTLDDRDVYARLFNNQAEPVSQSFRVNTTTLARQSGSDVAASSNGDFVVDWTTGTEGTGTTVLAQAYLPNGMPLGTEFRVSTRTPGFQGDPIFKSHIAFLNESDFVIVWCENSGATRPDVHARIFRISHDDHLCGDAIDTDLLVRTSDALAVLRATVGSTTCSFCACDTDGSGALSVADALQVIQLAIGLQVETHCPPCI